MKISIHGVDTYLEEIKARPLKFCLVGIVENTQIIQTDYIDDWQKFSALKKVAHSWKNEVKVCLNQINTVQTEWDCIDKQHQNVLDATCIHLLSNLGPIKLQEVPRQILLSEKKIFEKMQRFINAEAWITYCHWYHALLQYALSSFKYDATELYMLERHIMEYQHEVKSHYLTRTKERLKDLNQRKKNSDYTSLVNLEKEIIIQRKALYDKLFAHYNHLTEIVRLIPFIEDAHPELILAWQCGMLMKRLLAFGVGSEQAKPLGFDAEQIFLQLLNEELGILSALNSFGDLQRLNVAFSLRLATRQLEKVISREKTVTFALNFEQLKAKIYQAMVNAEFQQIVKWRENEESFNELFLFWKFFLKNLSFIQSINQKAEKKQFKITHLNPEYLNIIPPIINSKVLLIFDNQTGKPQGLTKEGLRFLQVS